MLRGESKADLLRLPWVPRNARDVPTGLRTGSARSTSNMASADARLELGRFDFNPESFAFRFSRPALKVQDGCDGRCAYCRVRVARGKSTSLPTQEALARARALENAESPNRAHRCDLSQYSDDGLDFPGLLRLLLAGTGRIAFRLSSYEPDRVDEAFLDVFADPRVRPHLHLAAQSGADSVLAAMGGLTAATLSCRRSKP